MSNKERKRDRTARLLRLQLLLWQNPRGLDIKELAQKCSISERTAYRDLEAIESELGVPIWEAGNKRGVLEGYFLPPITFTMEEAMKIFLAARLMQSFSNLYDPSLASTFTKLSTIVPAELKKQIQNTVEHTEKKPRSERKINNFNKLTRAWLLQHQVKILYQELYGGEPVEYIIEPYIIEPAALFRSSYVIAYCPLKKEICTFNIDRVIGDVNIQEATYEIPSDFNVNNYLNSAWGTFADKEVETVKLRFSKRTSRAVMSTIWHPSQKTEIQRDGSLMMTLSVNDTDDFRFWVRGWGNEVEVLEPETLRNHVINTVKSLSDVYDNTKSSRKLRPGENGADLTDEQWQNIVPLLPPQTTRGRPRADDRRTLDGILWVLQTGAPWADIPRGYGAFSTCHSRFHTWQKSGVWDRIQQVLFSSDMPAKGKIGGTCKE